LSKNPAAFVGWCVMAVAILLGAHLAWLVAVGGFGFPQDMLRRRADRRMSEDPAGRARFMQQVYAHTERRYGKVTPDLLLLELRTTLAASGNPFGRLYVIASLEGKTYIADVPADALTQACVLWMGPKGSGVDTNASPSAALRVWAEAAKGGTVACSPSTSP